MGLFDDVLLTVDYDRTLTGTNAQVPQRNLEAITFFIENGGKFTVNTGRSVPMAQCFLDHVPVNAPLLLYNGSGWYDPAERKLVRSYELGLDPQLLLTDLQTRFPQLTVEVQGVQNHYIFKEDHVWEKFCVYNGASWAYGDDSCVEQPFLKVALYSNFADETTASMYKVVPEEMALMEQAIAYIHDTYGDRIDVFRACARITDLHAKGCNKLRSARDLQAALGRKILVCVGDADNDVTMLEGADYAYCPADGIVADRFENVCVCDEGAVADVIYKKIPEILGFRLDKME